MWGSITLANNWSRSINCVIKAMKNIMNMPVAASRMIQKPPTLFLKLKHKTTTNKTGINTEKINGMEDITTTELVDNMI